MRTQIIGDFPDQRVTAARRVMKHRDSIAGGPRQLHVVRNSQKRLDCTHWRGVELSPQSSGSNQYLTAAHEGITRKQEQDSELCGADDTSLFYHGAIPEERRGEALQKVLTQRDAIAVALKPNSRTLQFAAFSPFGSLNYPVRTGIELQRTRCAAREPQTLRPVASER